MNNGFLVVSSSRRRARSTATRCAHVDALAAALCVQRVVCRPPSGYFQARRRGPRAAATARRVLGAMNISMVSARPLNKFGLRAGSPAKIFFFPRVSCTLLQKEQFSRDNLPWGVYSSRLSKRRAEYPVVLCLRRLRCRLQRLRHPSPSLPLTNLAATLLINRRRLLLAPSTNYRLPRVLSCSAGPRYLALCWLAAILRTQPLLFYSRRLWGRPES